MSSLIAGKKHMAMISTYKQNPHKVNKNKTNKQTNKMFSARIMNTNNYKSCIGELCIIVCIAVKWSHTF